MASIVINLLREGRHWRMRLAVNGKIESRDVIGCTDSMLPIIRGLMAAEAEAHTIFARPQGAVGISPPTITVGMPSGRTLTFVLRSVQDAFSEGPESVTSILDGSRSS